MACHFRPMSASGNGTRYDIGPAQARAARALLNWTREQLAAASNTPMRTVARFELGEGAPRATTVRAIRAALEAAGVIFTDGEEPGVKLRKAEP